VRFIEGDLAEPEALAWTLRPLVDLARPACLILALVVQALDPGIAQAVVGVLIRELAPGSHVVLTCGRGVAGRLPDDLSGTGLEAQDVAAFLAGLDVQPPGVQDGLVLCATGRKP
jgi:hypothetical protein